MNISGPKGLVGRIHSAPKLILFLDYDGTLADFANTPDDIQPDQDLIALIQALVDTPRIQPLIISGRKLEHIQKLIPLTGLWLAGTYGIQLQDPQGSQIDRVDYRQVRPLLERLKPFWQELIADKQGFYLEDKGWSLALHGKDADPQSAGPVFQAAKKAALEAIQGDQSFRLLGGDRFFEIAPAAASKAQAVEFLLKRIQSEDALIVYIGDDDKDEVAFKVILERHGIAIKVGDEKAPSAAQLRLKNPSEVRKFLTSLALND